MQRNMEERAQELGNYIVEHRATVRAAAARYRISKSTVHKDITERLRGINRGLYLQVQEVLQENKNERHIRGGMATKQKYESMRRK
ncbi:MAG: stage III sporulation protein D [Ruminococcaceae bacterium]|nr:stage III sporulation protein D [Oscillospiraceae bacterium]